MPEILVQSVDSTVVISNVPYGVNGSWAINFWLRADGPAHSVQRIFTHTAALNQNTLPQLWGANQASSYPFSKLESFSNFGLSISGLRFKFV